MPACDLDIGVVYTHEREMLSRLLATMGPAGDGLRMRLVLIDNASRDGVEPWRRSLDETRVLCNDRRLSYAKNLNRVLDAAEARYVLLMNTDMYFDPGEPCLRRMVEFMDARPRCGVAGCRLRHADGSEAHAARRFPTPLLIAARRCGLGRLIPGVINRHFYGEHALDEVWQCDWLSGCFLMVRREAVERIGRFDERYGKYFEDVDFCLRTTRAGWQVLYNGATSCRHLEQRASRRVLSRDALRHLRAYARWLRKWGLRP